MVRCIDCAKLEKCAKTSEKPQIVEVVPGCEDGKRKPITNGDIVREMSDEELSEFMCHNVSNGTVNCAFCAAAEFCRMGHNGWLDWLKQEATP